uniref:Uncharacterized protein n=1 Tax=Panagrolaimus sp. ES5 TaxID=591445 RepID=A0AC34GXK8_9BILA
MVNKDYLLTIHGIISIIQIVLGFIAIIIGAVVWSHGSVYILIFPDFAPGILYVLFALELTWSICLAVTAMQIMGKDVLQTLGKMKLMIYHGGILVVLLIAAGVESYYAGHVVFWVDTLGYKTRMILDTIILWILVVSHIVQLIFVALQR